MRTRIGLLATLLLIAIDAPANAFLLDFESPASLDSFDQHGTFLLSPGNGVGESSALTPNQSNSTITLVREEQPIRFSEVGDNASLSIMFQYRDINSVGGQGTYLQLATLGIFGDVDADNFRVPKLTAHYEIEERGGGLYRHQLSVFSISGSSGTGKKFSIDPLTAGNWYRLSAQFDFVDEGATPNSYAVQLDDFGVDGTGFVERLASETHDGLFSRTFQDDTAWVGFQVGRPPFNEGQIFVDNFRVVPEPHALAVMAITAFFSSFVRVRGRPMAH